MDLGIAGETADSVLPERCVAYRHVQLAPMPADEARAAMRWQGAAALDIDESGVVCSSVPMGTSERDHFLVATSRQDLEAHRAGLRESGLAIGRVDAAPLALCEAFAAPLVFCVDLLAERPALLISRGGDLVFHRCLDAEPCERGRASDELWHQVEQCRHFLGERMDLRDARLCVLGNDAETSPPEPSKPGPGGLRACDWRELLPCHARAMAQGLDARTAYLALIAFGLVWDGRDHVEECDAPRSAA